MPNQRANIKLIQKAVNEKWIRQLAFFHILKARFNNSCIYDYRSRMKELSEGLGISEKTLYNYFKALRAKDLVYDHSSNLMLRSVNTGFKKTIIDISDSSSLFDVVCLLYGKILEKKARSQAFLESIRRFKRGDRINSILCENPFLPSMSYRTVANILKINEKTAFKVVKNLDTLKIIKATRQKPVLISKGFFDLDSIKDFPGYRFNLKNCLFEVYGNKIEFLRYPVYLKKITIQQYKKFISSDL